MVQNALVLTNKYVRFITVKIKMYMHLKISKFNIKKNIIVMNSHSFPLILNPLPPDFFEFSFN